MTDMTAAQAAQQNNRDSGGKYATKVAAEASIELRSDTCAVQLTPEPLDLGVSTQAERAATRASVVDALLHYQASHRHVAAGYTTDTPEPRVVFFVGRGTERAHELAESDFIAMYGDSHEPVIVVALVSTNGVTSRDPYLAKSIVFDENNEAFCRPSAPAELRCFSYDRNGCTRVRHYANQACTTKEFS